MGRRTWKVERALVLLALIGTLAAVGCASERQRTMGDAEPYAVLVVENDGTFTVNVYAVRDGGRLRIGQVTALSTREFDLDQRMLSSSSRLQLMIDPIGSRRNYFSQPIGVYEGDIVEFRVGAAIR